MTNLKLGFFIVNFILIFMESILAYFLNYNYIAIVDNYDYYWYYDHDDY